MARVTTVCFDTASSSECRSLTGAAAFSSSIRRASVGYSFTCAPVTTGTANVRIGAFQTTGLPTAELNLATIYWRVYFYVTSLPSSLNEEIVVLVDTSGSYKSGYRITSTGAILVVDNAQATSYTTTATVSAGSFYRLEGMGTTSASASAYEIRLYTDPVGNGVAGTAPTLLESFTGSMTQGSANHGSLRVGKTTNRNGVGYTINFDDIAIDDAAWCDDSQMRLHLPAANGTTATAWTGGTGSSNYLEVDEVPEDDATTFIAKSAASDQTHYVTMQSCATVGVTGAIKSVKQMVRTQENVATTTATRPIVKSSATTAEGTGFNGSTTWVTQCLFRTTDPNTSVAWTTAAVDALECGVRDSAATTSARCSAIYLVTEFQAPINVTVTPNVLTVSVALQAPTLQTGAAVTPTALAGVLSALAATVQTGATAAPSVLPGSLALQVPATSGGAVASPAALSGTLTPLAPTVSTAGGVTVSVSAVAASLSLQAPALRTGATVAVSVLSAALSLKGPTVNTSATVSVGALSLTMTPLVPSVLAGATIPAGVLVAVLAPKSPAVAIGATASPAAIAAALATIPPAVVAGALVQAERLAATLTANEAVVVTVEQSDGTVGLGWCATASRLAWSAREDGRLHFTGRGRLFWVAKRDDGEGF